MSRLVFVKLIPQASLWHIADKDFDKGKAVLTLCLVRMSATLRKECTLRELMVTAPVCEGCMDEFNLAKEYLLQHHLLMVDKI